MKVPPNGFLRFWLVALAGVLLGLGASAPAAAAPTVDQTPLTVKTALAPDIVLMLDDSGSMAWNFMPDICYLNGVNCDSGNTTIQSSNNDALIDANNNGVYYNPNVTYTPPFTVTGGSYPAATGLTSAWVNGFATTLNPVDLTTYGGTSEVYFCNGACTGGSNIDFNTTTTGTSTYTATLGCPSGYSGPLTSGSHNGQCYVTNRFGSTTYTNQVYTCNSGDSLSGSTCTHTTTYNYFIFSTGAAAGPYKDYYVASASQGCQNIPTGITCVTEADTSGTAAPAGIAAGQNIANWFAYYHTRILTAKSGLMTAFSSLDPATRLGFGSIDGGNKSNISGLGSSLYYSYTDNYNSQTNYIATVQAFDQSCVTSTTSPCTPGASGTQRNRFWSWITGEAASGGTPLRQALNQVGQYYTTSGPWQNSSTDSTKLACRQAYTILTTDGFWNESTSNVGFPSNSYNDNMDGGPGGTSTTTTTSTFRVSTNVTASVCQADYNGAANSTTTVSNCKWNGATCTGSGTGSKSCQWSQTVTTTSSTGPSITNTNPTTGQSYTYSAINPYQDGNSDTLADVAMYYWVTDLQTGVANEVPTSTEDPAFWQHMTTFTVGLGFTPTGISPSGTTVDQIFAWADGGAQISGFSWPTPVSNSIYNIADLAHAGVDGHGGFYSATSPQAFSSGIADAIKRVATRNGSGASLAANSTSLQTGTITYQATYFSGVWTGELSAYNVNSDGSIAATPNWSASQQLPAASSRNIYTYNPSAASGSQFVTFSSPSSLSTAEKNALGNTSTVQQNTINYLRGDATNEQKNNGIYRNRTTPLGDIIDSQPAYVGAPDPNLFTNTSFTGATTYPTFAANNINRTPLLWVAGNDGMLHAFNANTGVETFAYMPAAVIINGVANLSNPDYGASDVPHQDYNDGEMTVADAYFGSTPTWRTILVGTTGRGTTKAVYALDITNPSSIQFLWERSASDGLGNSNYIGQMIGQPVIAQTANGTWSVLMGNGYNSNAGTADLLQFDLATGALTVYTTDASGSAGLAEPVTWIPNTTNDISTLAYAGDNLGRIWSFTLGSTGSAGTKLFTAKDSSGNVQPVTAGMLAGQDSGTQNVWLFFGTGEYLSQSDIANLTNPQTQTWYGIIVQTGPSQSATLVSNLTNGRSVLVQRSITAETEPSTDPPALGTRTVSTATAGDTIGKSGWYMDLVSPVSGAQGERVVTPNQFDGDVLFGTSLIPQSSDPCNPSGTGWIMAINPFTGAAVTGSSGSGGSNGSTATVFVAEPGASGVGLTSETNNGIFVGGGTNLLLSLESGGTGHLQINPNSSAKSRVSWRELFTH